MSDEVEALLIEDSPDDVAFFVRTFQRTGLPARLVAVSDGAAALSLLFGGDPAVGKAAVHRARVIFLDLKLPKVDGLEILRRLKTDPRTRGIPVVVMSSSQEERDLVESYRLGASSYVVKPMDFDEFAETVRTLTFYWLRFNQVPKC